MFDPNKRKTPNSYRMAASSTPSMKTSRQNKVSGVMVKSDDSRKSPSVSSSVSSHASKYSSKLNTLSSTKSPDQSTSVKKPMNHPSKPSDIPKLRDDLVATYMSDTFSSSSTTKTTIQLTDGYSKYTNNNRPREHKPLKNGWGLFGAAAAAAYIAYEYFQPRPDADEPGPWSQPEPDPWSRQGTNNPNSMVRPDPEGRGNGILINPHD